MEFQEKIDAIRKNLTNKEQRALSLNSIQNFVWAFNRLSNGYKLSVEKLLTAYFEFIEEEKYVADRKTTNKIGYAYISKIAPYYTLELGFKTKMTLQFALMVGIHLDIIFLIIGILHKVHYIPITTLVLLLRWFYVRTFFEKKHMVHNVGY